MKNEALTHITRNDVYTDSWTIAENLGYAHKTITTHITKHSERFKKMGTFYLHRVKSQGGRPAEIYELNEAQAIFLMTLLDNTERVLDFKAALAMAFVSTRRLLIERQTPEWRDAREQGKQVRLLETDAIQELVEYTRVQGNEHADKLYITYSKLVKKLAGYESRDTASAETLLDVRMYERLLAGYIRTEMANGTHYKDIYQIAKVRLTDIKVAVTAATSPLTIGGGT